MIDLTGATHHPAIEEVVDVLCTATQNTDRSFFRAEVAYFLGLMAGTMRATIKTEMGGDLPVNIYALCLAPSGFGKGRSVGLLEDDFTAGFRRRFLGDTLPLIAERSLWDLANDRALRANTNPQEEFDKAQGEYKRLGGWMYNFDAGSISAVKQLRQKMIMANIGALNLVVDEIGMNLQGIQETLAVFLELYDVGKTKDKLLKNGTDNIRADDLEGRTPANMLLFGTLTKLLDGKSTEELFYTLLETGYARRCIFGAGGLAQEKGLKLTAEQIYNLRAAPANKTAIHKWSKIFENLADPSRYGWQMKIEADVAIALIGYQMACEEAASDLRRHQENHKTELMHRHMKALKLAGALAFVDGATEIEMDHLRSAMLLVEESGEAFQRILTREDPHVRLGRYIADATKPVNWHNIVTDLPFMPKPRNQQNDQMTLAIAWGHQNHIIIKKSFIGDVEFYQGQALQATHLDNLMVSASGHWAYQYEAMEGLGFDQLEELARGEQEDGSPYRWCNHRFKDGHRTEENAIPGFNTIVVDVDGGVSLPVAHEILEDYVFATYTTKRHQTLVDGEVRDRFRIILPINYHLSMDTEEYREFMQGILSWLPFQTDTGALQRSKAWGTYGPCHFHANRKGVLFDALPFIPRTEKNAQHQETMKKIANLGALERWFAPRIGAEGSGRNNQMIKYALALVDSGMSYAEVEARVLAFDRQLQHPIGDAELRASVLVTAAKRCQLKMAA